MTQDCNLTNARKKLSDALGDNFKIYVSNMRLWFTQRISKEVFDREACLLMPPEHIKLHNDFLLAIFSKCRQTQIPVNKDGSSPSSTTVQDKDKSKKLKSKKKPHSGKPNFDQRFQTTDLGRYVPYVSLKKEQMEGEAKNLSFCSRDRLLPDSLALFGRMLVTSWDSGLDTVSDESIKLITVAVKLHIKNLLVLTLRQRKSCKSRDNRFVYNLGTPSINIYLKNAEKLYNPDKNPFRSVRSNNYTDLIENEDLFQESLSVSKRLPPVCLKDLYNTLVVHRNAIPSHTVYSINLERILNKLSHPTHEELKQQSILQQEMELKEQFRANQAPASF